MSSKAGKAGFWRRLGGFLIDGILLGLVGFALGTALFDTLARLPGPTRLIGLAVGVAYYGLLASGLGGGRTLGMRVVGAKVVGLDGRPLALGASLWRALWLQGPLIVNGMMLTGLEPILMQVWIVVAAALVFGVGVANLILIFGNGHTGRLVHDLLSGAVVVRTENDAPPTGEKRGAVVFAALAGVLVTALAFGLSQKAMDKALPFAALLRIQTAVAALPGVLETSVVENTMFSFLGGEKRQSLIVNARVATWPSDPQALADRIGVAVRRSYALKPGETIKVVLRRGYDIGIAQGWTARSYEPRFSAS
ncbi:RDD family protein [uncultured Caulobacter sp.]|uniref:RDD family protein n=1 Tax=uncultured Caulobacter sp. TaxID=158749 RepID=UPI00262D46FB|nr:RDD family protein [uncultured Caulobacter sp.]